MLPRAGKDASSSETKKKLGPTGRRSQRHEQEKQSCLTFECCFTIRESKKIDTRGGLYIYTNVASSYSVILSVCVCPEDLFFIRVAVRTFFSHGKSLFSAPRLQIDSPRTFKVHTSHLKMANPVFTYVPNLIGTFSILFIFLSF